MNTVIFGKGKVGMATDLTLNTEADFHDPQKGYVIEDFSKYNIAFICVSSLVHGPYDHVAIEDCLEKLHKSNFTGIVAIRCTLHPSFINNWENIYTNFLKIIKYKHIFKIEVCQTVSCLNVSNIDKFKEFTNKHDLIVAHNYVHHPSFHHVSIMPNEMKENILNNIEHLNDIEKEKLKTELYGEPIENGFEKFINFMKLLDLQRNVFIGDYLPEWKKYFN
jgi:hypothetical protein